MFKESDMNYRLNLCLLMLVFSVVTYNVCMAYQDMEEVNVQGKFQEIGLLETPVKFLILPRKPTPPEHELASAY
jgi:hypothetical protein